MAVPLAGYVLSFPEDHLPAGTTNMNDHSLDILVPSPHECLGNAMTGGPLLFSDEVG